jgi:hypothetical protein
MASPATCQSWDVESEYSSPERTESKLGLRWGGEGLMANRVRNGTERCAQQLKAAAVFRDSIFL